MKDKIFKEDCLEGMKRIPDGSVDMILCDLPYGTTQNKWDSVIPFEAMWAQFERIIKPNGAIVLTAAQPFTSALVMSNPRLFKYQWVWNKILPTGFLNANKQPLRVHEDVLVFYKKQPTYNPQKSPGKPYKSAHPSRTSENWGGFTVQAVHNETGDRFPVSIINVNKAVKGGHIHPTQKPVDLFTYLIRTYTNSGETVLDACIGSGTTAVAAIREKRHFIGFEKEEKYFDIAQRRIAEARQTLFVNQ